ncbi:hypothetical protein ZeamMp125 (mitochondrion) [Zea mays subsp. mays]|jgi:hypothetical protein|uniref:Uncharacterized protein n=1 Tax=Zea mays TaxID=4577 RepID=Q6R9C8_MAIZE|nr:hypothetical protein ZeamMp125 [Zea mays subsp. mays]AAR91102.1 hypothetical protein [Zea mays]WEB51500.1 hypothetical protein [Zea mays]WEB51661.1 hypothetical protein [Zea mays]|eukprot:YP_588380.1 hypothetical protein ZeamMp125 (mitochondrion) [Zea mays subsp. mays]
MPCSPRRGPWKSLVFYVLELPSSYSDPSPHMIPRNNTQLLSGYGNESSSPLSRDVPIAYPSRPMAHTPILFDLYPKGMELLSPFRGEGWIWASPANISSTNSGPLPKLGTSHSLIRGIEMLFTLQRMDPREP